MRTLLIAGYPKSGNTLFGEALHSTGGSGPFLDYYQFRRNNSKPCSNTLFSDDTYVIKTHERWRPNIDFEEAYFAKVFKIITVIRNPFDTLLSAINFIKVQFKNNNMVYKKTWDALFDGIKLNDELIRSFTLEDLREKGLLDLALKQFSNHGTSIPGFVRMSGPWSGFITSYKYCGLPILNLRYEELASLSEQSLGELDDINKNLLGKIAGYLEVNEYQLQLGFKLGRQKALNAQMNKNVFYNKMRSNYWRDYFSNDSCKEFVSNYAVEMIDNGYKDLVDEFYSSY